MVVSRTPERAQALAERAREAGVDAARRRSRTTSPTRTSSARARRSDVPLFDGGLLAPGAHVNAVGSYRPTRRELDTATVARARVVVESREVGVRRGRRIVRSLSKRVRSARDHVVADLAEVVHGADVRTSPDDITVFKSVGLAFEDLIVARAAVGAAKGAAKETG